MIRDGHIAGFSARSRKGCYEHKEDWAGICTRPRGMAWGEGWWERCIPLNVWIVIMKILLSY